MGRAAWAGLAGAWGQRGEEMEVSRCPTGVQGWAWAEVLRVLVMLPLRIELKSKGL